MSAKECAGHNGENAGVSPLWRAAQNGRLASEWSRERVRRAVQTELEQHAFPWDHASSLYIAAANGWLECVRVLLEAKATAELANEPARGGFLLWVDWQTRQRTPLRAASQSGHVDVIRLLLAHKAAPDISKCARTHWLLPCSPLHAAIDAGHTQAVRVLVAAGADVNMAKMDRRCGNRPPLLCAVEQDNLCMVRAIVEGKASVDQQHRYEVNTPLCLAAATCRAGMVRTLLHLKADANRASEFGCPLGEALTRVKSGTNHPAVVQLLLRAKAKAELIYQYEAYAGLNASSSALPAPVQDAVRCVHDY